MSEVPYFQFGLATLEAHAAARNQMAGKGGKTSKGLDPLPKQNCHGTITKGPWNWHRSLTFRHRTGHGNGQKEVHFLKGLRGQLRSQSSWSAERTQVGSDRIQ